MTSGEEIVFSSECDGSDLVFNEVVVDQELSIEQVATEVLPPWQGVCDGGAELVFGSELLPGFDQPGFERFPDGLCFPGSQFEALGVGELVFPGLSFEVIELPEDFERMRYPWIILSCLKELSSGMCHASKGDDAFLFLELMVDRGAVGLEVSLEVFQAFEWFWVAFGCLVFEQHEPFEWGVVHAKVTQVNVLCFLVVEDFDGCLIGLQVRSGEHFFAVGFEERAKQVAGPCDPISDRSAWKVDSGTLEALDLPVKGEVIGVLVQQDAGQQTGFGQPLVDGA